jgi:outer membrane protein assembly factor BamD (BamD/ComL family)
LPALEASDVKQLPSSSASPSARAVASTSDDLSEQIRLIEAARAGVAAHDSKAALAALDGYTARFPRGSFGQEATVLRIRALEQAGDFARAGAMAKAFIARFPRSPHVARLKPIAERASLK